MEGRRSGSENEMEQICNTREIWFHSSTQQFVDNKGPFFLLELVVEQNYCRACRFLLN